MSDKPHRGGGSGLLADRQSPGQPLQPMPVVMMNQRARLFPQAGNRGEWSVGRNGERIVVVVPRHPDGPGCELARDRDAGTGRVAHQISVVCPFAGDWRGHGYGSATTDRRQSVSPGSI